MNNKAYIGQTCQKPERRWRNGEGYSHCSYFYNAIQKYGWDNFEHKILETVTTQEKANEREQYWIKFYNSNNNDYGYNLTTGSNNCNLSEEIKQKMKDSWTPERRQAQAERLHQRWVNNPEWAEKMKELAKNIPKKDMSGENNPMYGTHRIGKDAARKRKVQCIETGEIFDTIIEAARWSNEGKITNKAHISAVCKGKRKTSGRHPETGEPLHWKYVDDMIKQEDEKLEFN